MERYGDQTALDKIWSYAQAQKEPSQTVTVGKSCLYNSTTKSGEENHCWVGVLLEGCVLDDADNQRDVESLMEKNEQVRERLGFCNLRFLQACQEIHDTDESWTFEGKAYRLNKLRQVAKQFVLKVPEEEEEEEKI